MTITGTPRRRLKFEAVLFDIDGTLLDTREYIFQAYEHTFRTQGWAAAHRDRLALLVGRPLEECYLELAPGCDAAACCETHRAFQQSHPGLSTVFPGIPDLLAELTSRGAKLGAITSRKLTARNTLRLAGIDRFLRVVLDGDDVRRHKPHPEPVLTALAEFGVAPDAAVMVGDAPVDIECGRNAGAATIGVTYGFHGELIRAAGPDAIAASPSELAELLFIPD